MAGGASFGQTLRALRLRARLTQRELADRAGVSVRAVRYIEQGRGQPRPASRRRLADAVGLVLDEVDREHRLGIAVLGRFEVTFGGRAVEVGPAKQRSLLALLALRPNQVVSADELIDVLWAEPPESCQNLVHTYVSRLRKVIGAQAGRLVSAPHGGYRLNLDADQLDLLRFDALVERARRTRGEDLRQAVLLLQEALDLWRGPPVADLPAELRGHPVAQAVAARRIAVALEYADTALALGLRQDRVVELLRVLATEDPLHEAVHARLMLALAASGQQAAALALFTEVRARLDEELGVEPGPEITDAQLRILRHNHRGEVTGAPGLVPAQLPADVAGFAGRADYLERLDSVLRNGSGLVISTITGTAGVGKTALAVHWAHRVRHRFPDGQLFVNLRGYAPGEPVRPRDVLARFLHALGVPAERAPADDDEAAGLYRTLLADRRMLVVLDNAVSAEQVRPLLPGSPGSLVLVTSRDRLTALVAREGAHRLTLDVLDPGEATALVARIIGPERVGAEPDAVAELCRACAFLPLALRIAAANLAERPYLAVAEFTAELASGGLAELTVGGDEGAAVRAAFDVSFGRLGGPAARLFGLLGLVPGSSFTAEVAAALAGVEPRDARVALDALVGAHLVQPHGPGRYSFHDLLREYAIGRARESHTGAELRDAGVRFLEFYLHTMVNVIRTMPNPDRKLDHLDIEPAAVTPIVFDDFPAALEWCDAERANLVAAVGYADSVAPGRTVWQLAGVLLQYFLIRSHMDDWFATHDLALAAARRAGDSLGEASVLGGLGLAHFRLEDFARAIDYHGRSLAIYRRIGHRSRAASTLINLALSHLRLGDYPASTRHARAALVIAQEIDSSPLQAASHHALAYGYLELEAAAEALDHAHRALRIWRASDNRDHEALTLRVLGMINEALGQDEPAVRAYQRAATLHRETGAPYDEAVVLVTFGDLCRRQGDLARARSNWQQAHALFTELRHPAAEDVAERLAGLGLPYALPRSG